MQLQASRRREAGDWITLPSSETVTQLGRGGKDALPRIPLTRTSEASEASPLSPHARNHATQHGWRILKHTGT